MRKTIIAGALAIALVAIVSFAAGGAKMKITSSAFQEGGNIPSIFTYDGGDTSQRETRPKAFTEQMISVNPVTVGRVHLLAHIGITSRFSRSIVRWTCPLVRSGVSWMRQ